MERLCSRPRLLRNTKKISAAEVSKQPRLNINNRRAGDVELQTPTQRGSQPLSSGRLNYNRTR